MERFESMRKNNSVWDNIPRGWYIRGGMIVPKPNHKKFVKL